MMTRTVRTQSLCRVFAALFAILVGSAPSFTLSSTLAPGTPDTRGVPGYAAKVYQVQDGLPEDNVQAFAQTPDRYLWIGTTAGLVRFDGTNFTTFNRENTPAFRENSVFCLLATRDGSLWIGTEGSGLIRYHNGIFRSYGAADGLTDSFVRAVAEDRSGTIWVGTNNGLFQVVGDRVVRLDGTPTLPAIAVNAFRQDSAGRLWIGGSRLLTLNAGIFQEHVLPGELTRNRVKSILETRDGVIWVGTVSGLYRFDSAFGRFSKVPGIHGTVRVLRQTADGTVWVSIVGQGGFTYHLNKHGQLADPIPLPNNTVLAIFQDIEQNVWVGTQAGMIRFSQSLLSIVPLPDAKDSDFGTVYQDTDGSIWAASAHLFHIQHGIATEFIPSQVEGAKVRNVLRTHDGALWFGTEGNGLFRTDAHSSQHFTTHQGLVNNYVRAMVEGGDGSLWVGTDEGVSHIMNGHITNYQMRDGLAYLSIRSMLLDHKGDLWIGTELGLSHMHGNAFVQDLVVDTLRQDKVWAIHEDFDGGLWFGTRNNGLYRYRSSKLTHFRTEQGLASNSLDQILEDRLGNMWMSSPSGISLLRRKDLDAFADGERKDFPLTFYGISNETETAQIFGSMQTAGCITANGDVWFPSNLGAVHVAANAVMQARTVAEEQPPPPLVINHLIVDGNEVTNTNNIVLSPGSNRLEIRYAPVMLRSQDGIRFKYKLESFDKDWNQAQTRREAFYTNIPPGHYRFVVAAFVANAPGKTSEAVLTFTKRPYFYRTWWFALCTLALAGAIVLAVYRLRLNQMRQRFVAVIEERNRLAREMHDTIIQGCASVSAVLEAVSSMSGDSSSLKDELLNCARTQVRSTIVEAREAVWNLRDGGEPVEDIGASMEKMTALLSVEFSRPVACRLIGRDFPIARTALHELLMITREAVHNAVLHGASPNVDVCVDFKETDFSITVVDYGCGFAVSDQNGMQKHYGLVGMKERANSLGGSLSIESSPGQGTRINIRMPHNLKLKTVSPLQVKS
jgi:ligand-binding sensor domain-containing protein/signal transduction histidine kinase